MWMRKPPWNHSWKDAEWLGQMKKQSGQFYMKVNCIEVQYLCLYARVTCCRVSILPKTCSGKDRQKKKYSSGKIFVTFKKIRHFRPTKICPVRYCSNLELGYGIMNVKTRLHSEIFEVFGSSKRTWANYIWRTISSWYSRKCCISLEIGVKWRIFHFLGSSAAVILTFYTISCRWRK